MSYGGSIADTYRLAGSMPAAGSSSIMRAGRAKSNGLPAAVLSGSLEAPPVARQWAPGRDCALVATKELSAARQAAASRVVSGCEPVPDWGFRASVAGCSDRSVDLDPAFERLISNGYLLWTSSRIAERRALAELYSRAESACDHS